MITPPSIVILIVIATLGHAMALVWYLAFKNNWGICGRAIYNLPIKEPQIQRELKNSLHAPMHALILFGFAYLGFFGNSSFASFAYTLTATFVSAEIWHYGSHRAFHLRSLHWIHAEHHKSRINSPFTAISFSFTEKLVFDLGLIGALAVADHFISLNFFGIATWYIVYLVVNSFSHANFELKPGNFNQRLGKVLTTTTYHSLHHSRYTRNYGLGTRVLDKLFKTEWEDYEEIYGRVARDECPLTNLKEKIVAPHQA